MRNLVITTLIITIGLHIFGLRRLLAQEKECAWWEKATGLCTGLSNAGENVGKGVKEGLESAGDSVGESVFASFNYWAKVIEDYHAGDEKAKAKARAILKGVFGSALGKEDPTVVNWVVSLGFYDFDTANGELRVAVMRDTAGTIQNLGKEIQDGSRVDFDFENIVGKATGVSGVRIRNHDYLEKEVKRRSLGLAQLFAADYLHPTWGQHAERFQRFQGVRQSKRPADPCASIGQRKQLRTYSAWTDSECYDKLVETYQSEITATVMKVFPDDTELPDPVRTREWPWTLEPFLTILIPGTDLAKQPDLKIYLTIHKKGEPDKPIVHFSESPREISVPLMRERSFETDDPRFEGDVLNAAIVKLN